MLMRKEESLRLRQTVQDAFFKKAFRSDPSLRVMGSHCAS